VLRYFKYFNKNNDALLCIVKAGETDDEAAKNLVANIIL
jgi:hypothetical protein